MSEIIEKPLNEIGCSFLSGFAFKSSDYSNKGIPLIKIGNIQNRVVTVDSNGDRISEELINDRTKRFLLSNNDVLIAMTGQGSVGRVGKLKLRNGDKAFLNQRVGKFLCDEVNVNKDYLYYILTTNKYQDYLFNTGAGSGQPNLSPELILKTEIPWVEYPEQTAIASVLSSLDDKIDLLHRQNATLEQMAETLFRQWFVEEAKEEWEETTLENHTEVFRGLSYKGSGLSEIGVGLPMHNLNSVYEGGGYKYEGIKFYKGEYKERHLVNTGDIIVTNTEQGHEFRLIGFPAIVPDYYGLKGLFSQHIYKLIPIEDSYLSNEFLYYLLMTSSVREQIIAATNGSTVNMLAIDGLQRPEFKLPPKDLVEIFTTIVYSYWKKKYANQTQIRTLTSLRDTLLPKLMSGEVRVV
ncbi:type I restriction enzyme, S subunit [Flexibacter flexilis DSM 6793]|uniref:Type I restriction enzyme, S subunit n=1 Tax=Flexibacter flexilis DSM 6793 TaxID=927664 RepID=A0A1I1DU76_9BACT|nr:restriction endonuclease subunit S [Flexibacter flexilis]SFB76578.1 type I restriction enzyme, S subunit [Flexibacter flexilis DSM 6793]